MVQVNPNRTDYFKDTQKALKRYYQQELTLDVIKWVFKRYLYYAVRLLVHGRTLVPRGGLHFSMEYEINDNRNWIKKQARFADTSVMHGLYFTVTHKSPYVEKLNYDFKPSHMFRRMISEQLNDPDLVYNLIAWKE